jgi:predicted PolB exonuclease-like 3'-5' exonuclease
MSTAEAYENKVALYPEFGAITCLSYGTWSENGMQISTVSGENEKEVLEKIRILFLKAGSNGLTPTGWNIKNFDIPWIVRKMMMYGIDVPDAISSFDKKPWEVNIFDMKEMWKGWCSIDCNFEEAAYSMGVPSPKDDIDGSQTHSEFWKGNIERIATYCEKDVKAMIQMAEKMAKISTYA